MTWQCILPLSDCKWEPHSVSFARSSLHHDAPGMVRQIGPVFEIFTQPTPHQLHGQCWIQPRASSKIPVSTFCLFLRPLRSTMSNVLWIIMQECKAQLCTESVQVMKLTHVFCVFLSFITMQGLWKCSSSTMVRLAHCCILWVARWELSLNSLTRWHHTLHCLQLWSREYWKLKLQKWIGYWRGNQNLIVNPIVQNIYMWFIDYWTW